MASERKRLKTNGRMSHEIQFLRMAQPLRGWGHARQGTQRSAGSGLVAKHDVGCWVCRLHNSVQHIRTRHNVGLEGSTSLRLTNPSPNRIGPDEFLLTVITIEDCLSHCYTA